MIASLKLPVALPFILLVALLSSAGCGGGTSVEGTVDYNGQPIAEGTISFVSADGKVTVNEDIRSGKYAIDKSRNLVAGKYKVEIHAKSATPPAGDPDMQPAGGSQGAIPAKYNSQSELTAELGSGSNTQDFHLTP